MNQAMANRLGGLLMGFGAAAAPALILAVAIWESQAPAVPDPARGLVHMFEGRHGPHYATAVQFYGLVPLFLAAVLILHLGWAITPKRRNGGRNPYDRSDKAWERWVPTAFAPVSNIIGALAGLGIVVLLFLATRP